MHFYILVRRSGFQRERERERQFCCRLFTADSGALYISVILGYKHCRCAFAW